MTEWDVRSSAIERRKTPPQSETHPEFIVVVFFHRSCAVTEGWEEVVPSGGGTSVGALRVRGSKETRRLDWRFVVKSVKVWSLVRSATSPSVHVSFPPESPLPSVEKVQTGCNTDPRSVHTDHTHHHHTHTHKHTNWVEIRRYKKILKKEMIKHKTTQTDMKLASGTFDTNRACAVRSEGSSGFSLLVFKTEAPPSSSPRLEIIHNISLICEASSSQLHRLYVWCRRESFCRQVCPSLPLIVGQRATKKNKNKTKK